MALEDPPATRTRARRRSEIRPRPAVQPLAITATALATCLGRGRTAHLRAIGAGAGGLAPCRFETVGLDTWIGEVAGVDEAKEELRESVDFLKELYNERADIATTHAAESALLRAEKTAAGRTEGSRALAAAAVKVFLFGAAEKVASAARRAAFYVAEGDTGTMLLAGIRRYTKYDATGLLQAKRLLADAIVRDEKVPL